MEEKMDVEEISLRELIEVLLKGKKVIALFLVVAILLSTVVSFYLRENNKMAKIIISLNFEGIESGLNPDGTKFDINVIKSPAVLLRALESLEMNELDITIDSIRRNLTITPIVPKQIANYIQSQIEEGKEYTYFPNEFVITLNVDKTRGIKNSNVKELLDEIINSYAEYFDMSTLFWTYFYRTIYINPHEFVCNYKIIYLVQSRVNELAIARP